MSNAGGNILTTNNHVHNGHTDSQQMTNSQHRFIETIDPDDPEYRRELQRPPDVKEDMRQMESRQRVSSILNSQAFREELESIIADQLKHGPHPASLIALQQISDLLLPSAANSRWHHVSNMGKGGNIVIPINDIRGIDSLNYGKGERLMRCKLASLFRLIDLYGWSNNAINNCVSLRLNSDADHYLVNPYGLMYHEITASSLIKCDINGNIIENGSTTYTINRSLFELHAAIYKARPDIKCIIHVHTDTTNAISILKCGLLALTQESMLLGNISYHEFKGSNNYLNDESIRRLLAVDFGPINKILFIRNYGVMACGENIEEAWFYILNSVYACETQLRLFQTCGGNTDQLYLPNDEQKRIFVDSYMRHLSDLSLNENKKWRLGELEFEACMRCLDNAAYRTGYVYRQPIMRSIDRNAIKEVEIPPSCSSYTQDPEYLKKLKEEKQKFSKSEWLATPNVYAKTELEETGPYAKKVTKWVPDNSPSKTSTPIRIDNKNQFAPQGTDPKEYKNQQKQIKQDRYEDKKTPGYQSKILENILVNSNKDDNVDGLNNGENQHLSSSKEKLNTNNQITSSQQNGVDHNHIQHHHHHIYQQHGSPTYVYGAVSKGIIKRDQQNNSVVYKSLQSSPNPFQQMDKDDLEKYKKDVAEKQLKEQVQRKDDMHKELLEKKQLITSKHLNRKPKNAVGGDKSANNEVVVNVDVKKKSNTIPRSQSLLDKKNGDAVGSTSTSSRESSPKSNKRDNKLNNSVGVVSMNKNDTLPATIGQPSDGQTTNRSATLSTSSVGATSSSTNKEQKQKKKSKLRSLSFLKSSKKSSSSSKDA